MTVTEPPGIPDHELLRLIGRGAYGEVWLARNVMGVMRAVKVVRRSSFENHRPFEREFAAVKRYEPVSRTAGGLVNVLHAGRAADDAHFYYVMELADAAEPGIVAEQEPDKYIPCTLRTQIGRMGRMPVAECLEVAVSLAGGVAELHRVGLVHRDVKPSNIIFVSGRAKLADIGLVGDISESRSYVGTEGYVPPEGPGLPGADVYGLGRVLYEMATGYEATRFPALPPDWAQQGNAGAFEFYEIVLRCCEPDAARRYQTAGELLADLALLQSGQSVRQVRQLRGRIAFFKRAVLITAGLSIVAGGVAWWQGQEAETQRRLVERAENAEAEARRNLFNGLVQHARNARRSGDHDARFTALDLLNQAAALHPGDPAVRHEYISALATPGLRVLSTRRHDGFAGVCNEGLTRRFAPTDSGGLTLMDLTTEAPPQDIKVTDTAWALPAGVSPDGARLFARDDRGVLRVWQDGQPAAPLTAEGTGDCWWGLNAATTRALGWRQDGTVTVLDPGAPQQRTVWRCRMGFRHNYDPGAALTPDGMLAAFAASEGRSVDVHALPDGKQIAALESPRPLSSALAIAADGSVVAAGLQDGGIAIWRLRGSRACEIIEAGISFISSLAVTPDGRFLLSGAWSGNAFLWDLTDGTRLARVRLPFGSASFSKDGTRLVMDGGIRVALCEFNGADICRGLTLPRLQTATRDGLYGYTSLHPRAPWLIVSASQPTLLVDAAQPAVLQSWPVRVDGAVFAPSGGSIFIPGPALLRLPLTESGGAWQSGTPQVLAAGSRMQYPAVDAAGGSVAVRTVESWRIIRQEGGTVDLPPSDNYSDNFTVSEAAGFAAAGQRGGSVRIFRLSDGQEAASIPCAGTWPSTAFSPDGATLLVSDARHLRLFRSGTWEELWSREDHAGASSGSFAGFDPSGRYICGPSQPGSVALREAATGRILTLLQRERESLAPRALLSADGSMLWESDSQSLSLWRWDLHTLRSLLRARGLDWTTDPLPPPIPNKAPPLEGSLFGMESQDPP